MMERENITQINAMIGENREGRERERDGGREARQREEKREAVEGGKQRQRKRREKTDKTKDLLNMCTDSFVVPRISTVSKAIVTSPSTHL